MPTYKKFHEIPLEVFDRYISSNIHGTLWLIHHLLPALIARNYGRLILISSVSTQTGTSLYSMYCTAKAALEGLFLNLAVDYGMYNILANIVRAGLFKTSRTKLFWQNSDYQEKMAKIIPQGTMGEPEQLAESLTPLLSPSSYMNGSIMTVSGGLPMIGPKGLS
jgi:3-oxoacyl-[acyl-carrier protein] reductase